MRKSLFDNNADNDATGQLEKPVGPLRSQSKNKKEDMPLNRLKNLDESIAAAIGRVKTLKEGNRALTQRIKDLEAQLNEKNMELERVSSEKSAIKGQITDLLTELEAMDLE